jgi:hypothetical protein
MNLRELLWHMVVLLVALALHRLFSTAGMEWLHYISASSLWGSHVDV